MFHDTECTEEKMWEADQNIERSVTTAQITEMVVALLS